MDRDQVRAMFCYPQDVLVESITKLEVVRLRFGGRVAEFEIGRRASKVRGHVLYLVYFLGPEEIYIHLIAYPFYQTVMNPSSIR